MEHQLILIIMVILRETLIKPALEVLPSHPYLELQRRCSQGTALLLPPALLKGRGDGPGSVNARVDPRSRPPPSRTPACDNSSSHQLFTV